MLHGHSITLDADKQPVAVTILSDEGVRVADHHHPRFEAIVHALLRDGDDAAHVEDLFDTSRPLVASLRSVTDRVTAVNGHWRVDGLPLADEYANLMQQATLTVDEGRSSLTVMARFIADIAHAPEGDPRRTLLPWLAKAGLRIDDDGAVWGYKKVRIDREDPDLFRSIHAGGGAMVDGEYHDGTGGVPQRVGSTVSLSRSACNDNPAVGCGAGLHVGSLDYAESFGPSADGDGGGALLLVKFQPHNVVSVPSHARYRKVRVCEYEVVAVLQSPEAIDTIPTPLGVHVPTEVAMTSLDIRCWADHAALATA